MEIAKGFKYILRERHLFIQKSKRETKKKRKRNFSSLRSKTEYKRNALNSNIINIFRYFFL